MIIAAILATIIGLLLGLLGGGGSILTVPVLVFVLDLKANTAIVTALIIVAITSAIAVLSHARNGCVCWKTGLTFSASGIPAAFFGGRLSAYIPEDILLLLFALIMLVASFSMLRGRAGLVATTPLQSGRCPQNLPLGAILIDGFMVGLITGLVGVGGGFLLVPTLIFLVGLPMHAAIGTSLFIITLQSLSALGGHYGAIDVPFVLIIVFASFAIMGSIIGSLYTQKISAEILKKVFGVFVLLVACFMIYQDLNQEMLDQIKKLINQNKQFLFGALTMFALFLGHRLRVWVHSRSLD